ncbi:hypothetical protein WKK05_10615 [Nostoc sp. UHCC 0302]|uniref:hypothetical protein n=1 Tax=Nostoc sp. UHCC 0302 TaxID=3134896 RepID=UPI00311CD299
MKKIFSNFVLIIATVLTFMLAQILPCQAITFDFNWNGNGSYSAKGSFSYDESTAPQSFSENGKGATNVLKSFNISFFDSHNNLSATYNNVVNGVSNSNLFKFNFNTVTQEIFGEIDLGGEIAGDTYLSGTVNNKLSLFNVPQSGSDLIIDSNPGAVATKPTST